MNDGTVNLQIERDTVQPCHQPYVHPHVAPLQKRTVPDLQHRRTQLTRMQWVAAARIGIGRVSPRARPSHRSFATVINIHA